MGSATSPSVTVVAPLKPERIRLAEFSIANERFICLKAGSYNKSVALPGSISTLCTSKPLIQRVSNQCIIVGHNDFVRADRRKGCGAIQWLGFFMVAFCVDSIYPSLNCGSP